MALNPVVQKNAQEEIDRVIGTDRLPNPEDRSETKMPYLEALMKETVRWNSLYPLVTSSFPRRLRNQN